MEPLTDSLVSLLQRVARLESAWMQPRLAKHNITLAEFRLAGLLVGEKTGLTQRELAERLSVSGATVSVALRGLEARGVVVRTPDANDARVKRVKLTASRRRTDRARALIEELEEVSLATVSARDVAVAKRVLRRMADNLDAST